jgi:hypothetical protein
MSQMLQKKPPCVLKERVKQYLYFYKSLQLPLQQAPKWTNFKPSGTTRNKAIAREHANRSAYQIQ